MENKNRINTFTLIIIILAVVASIEIFMVIKNIFLIKKSNISLENDMLKLKSKNANLMKENKLLKDRIRCYLDPGTSLSDTPDGWRIYRYIDWGFETAYPEGGKIELSTVTDGKEHNGVLDRLAIYDRDLKTKADITIIDAKNYDDIKKYINGRYNYRVYFKTNHKFAFSSVDIYKLSGEKYYYAFFIDKKYIIEISSSSEDFLKKISTAFKFI